jgi:hypothetical protein
LQGEARLAPKTPILKIKSHQALVMRLTALLIGDLGRISSIRP